MVPVINVMSCRVCNVVWCDVMYCGVCDDCNVVWMWCDAMWCDVVWCMYCVYCMHRMYCMSVCMYCMYRLYRMSYVLHVCVYCMYALYVLYCIHTPTIIYEYQPECSDHTRVSCDTQPKQSKNTESWKAVTYISVFQIYTSKEGSTYQYSLSKFKSSASGFTIQLTHLIPCPTCRTYFSCSSTYIQLLNFEAVLKRWSVKVAGGLNTSAASETQWNQISARSDFKLSPSFSWPKVMPWKFNDQCALPTELRGFRWVGVPNPRTPGALWLKHMEKRCTWARSKKPGTWTLARLARSRSGGRQGPEYLRNDPSATRPDPPGWFRGLHGGNGVAT